MNSPIDLLFNDNYINKEISDKRLDICNGCEKFIKITKQCKECGCIMPLKVKLKDSTCPLNKW